MEANIELLQRQVNALEKSVRHWEENAAAESPFEVRTGASGCACCVEFRNLPFEEERRCEQCPVKLTTGYQYCEGTPYNKVYRLKYYSDDQSELPKAVKDELTFLRDVLTLYKDKLEKAQHDQECTT